MRRALLLAGTLLCGVCLLLFSVASADAQNRPVLITENVSESKLLPLTGNTRPEATAKNDRGPVADSFLMTHLLLLMKRSPEQARELEEFIAEIHDSSSPNFHRWLTADEFGARFGLAKQDRDTIKSWLQSHGFEINVDYTNGLFIDISGTAGQVRETFHTEIHHLEVNGVRHIANMSDPQIPAALAPAIVGIVSLNDFRPRSMYKPRAEYTVSENSTTDYLVAPGDLAKIYDLAPLFSDGVSGQGQTVVVIEDSDVYSPTDWDSFRSTFGLSSYTAGSFTQVHPAPPSGSNNCSDPGAIFGVDLEATIDAQYATASAPSAAIVLASCTSTQTFGGLIALQNLLNQSNTPPALMSISYGECEAANGASSNAAFNSTFEQAVAEGVSVFVAAGDNSAASCDRSDDASIYGIGITGWGSSPHAVAVGGTDFGDTFARSNGTYWKSTNSSTYESAESYVPEIPWEDSCASSLLAKFEGFGQTYGAGGFCNSSQGESNFLTTVGGGGGPSGCATGTPSTSGVVSGTCAGWAKPSYQSVLGNPHDNVRDIPDVSLFAANGLWLHAYPYCYSGPGGVSCSESPAQWPAAGGTSFSTPVMAGIQALVNQKAGSRQGNPNFVYYQLASSQYGTKGDSACDSTLGNAVASSCIFYDVTQGDNNVPCLVMEGFGQNNCYVPSGAYGVLSVSNNDYEPAYTATTGWDFSTGIGTVNAYNLVNNWPIDIPNFSISGSPGSLTVVQGTHETSTITIKDLNGFDGSVTFTTSSLPTGVTAAFKPNPTTSSTTLTLTASTTATKGTVAVIIKGTSGTLANTTSLSLTVSAPVPTFELSASPNSVSVIQSGSSVKSTVTVTPVNDFSGEVSLSASGLPTGVTASFSPNPATSTSTLSFTASATAVTGVATVTITGTSGTLKQTTTIELTVNPPGPNFSLSASPSSLSMKEGNSGATTITIQPSNGFKGSVEFSASGLPSGVTAAFSPNPGTTSTRVTFSASPTATIGDATVTITGKSGSLVQVATIKLTIILNLTLSAEPKSLTVVQGSSGATVILVTPEVGFVTLSASGLPSGVTAKFGANPALTNSTLTLTASSTATTGSATITVTGTYGSVTATTTIALTVNPPPSFSLTASPSPLMLGQNSSGSLTVTIVPVGGFNGKVTLSASGFPSGVTASFSENPATSSSTLTVKVSASTTTGVSTPTITGTSGTLSKEVSFGLIVQ